ncbi:MAG: YcbK family protein [Paracoccaceae bacterium]
MTTEPQAGLPRRRFLRGVLTTCLATATQALPGPLATPALARGAGDLRRLKLANARTDERVDCVFWADGAYIPEALHAIDHILRDWRRDEVVRIDPDAVEILAEVQRRLDCAEAFEVVSGYRSPATNAWLRRRRRGVARNSYHTRGMAVDVTMRTRSIAQIARAGLALGQGGVGRYTRSHFVHLDSGPVRRWGR